MPKKATERLTVGNLRDLIAGKDANAIVVLASDTGDLYNPEAKATTVKATKKAGGLYEVSTRSKVEVLVLG